MPTRNAKGAGRSPKKKAKRSEESEARRSSGAEAKRPARAASGLLRRRIEFGVLVAIVVWYAVVLITRTVARGDDFQVFYRVAQRFWDGVRPYDQVTYGNMVFKYPPWILPFFLPFGFLDLATAKVLWGFVEAASLVAIVTRLHRGFGDFPGVRPAVQSLFLLMLFALFGSHGMTGQITLVALALAVWADPVRSSFRRFFFLSVALSAKLTSLFPMIHAVRRKKIFATTVGVGLLFVLLSLPIYFKSYGGHYGSLRDEWTSAMFSGTQDVNSVRIGFTTREVQGLPSFLLRKGGLDERQPVHVLFATFLSLVAIGGAWAWFGRRLPPLAQWIGWLALLPAVQPLAWFHVFLFVYPLLVLGAEIAIRENRRETRRWRFAGFVACGLLVGAITAKTMGPLGSELELASVKLWGTLGAVGLFMTLFRDRKEIG
ncbi:MAG: DUF2029 domain-containing protein [Bdellovibrionales bacterium]|nr:DUF2029 domain-containing protein [Bdellovibrionales bacterium]